MSYLLIGLCVPLASMALLLGMASYERWMLRPPPARRRSQGYARSALVAALVASVSESVDLADDRASLRPIAHVGLALAAGRALLLRRYSWRAAIAVPMALFLPLAVVAVVWKDALEGFSLSAATRATARQISAVAKGLPGALLAIGAIGFLRWRRPAPAPQSSHSGTAG